MRVSGVQSPQCRLQETVVSIIIVFVLDFSFSFYFVFYLFVLVSFSSSLFFLFFLVFVNENYTDSGLVKCLSRIIMRL